MNQTSTLWWSGSDWATSELYLTASGPTPWWFPSFTLLSGRTYVVKAKAVDQAGTEGSDSTNITFTFDNAKPTSLITSPLDASVRRLVTGLTGTAGDVSPGVVTNVQSQIKRLSETKYYDGAGAFYTTVTWLNRNGGTVNNWDYTDANLDTPLVSGPVVPHQSSGLGRQWKRRGYRQRHLVLLRRHVPDLDRPLSGERCHGRQRDGTLGYGRGRPLTLGERQNQY